MYHNLSILRYIFAFKSSLAEGGGITCLSRISSLFGFEHRVKLNSLFSCHYSHDYDVHITTICMLYLFFGVFCTFFGYRCFKATMFLMGFVFGSLVVYLICMEENILPMWANTSIAVSAGVLFGLITLLVQYVGLFMLGFHGGLILGIIILCSIEIFGHSQSSPDSPWISVGILLLCGLVMSLCNLYFQVRI